MSNTLEPPDQLRIVERHASEWIAELEGPATALTYWFQEHCASVRDFTVGPPDLETVFYQQSMEKHHSSI